MLSHKSSILFLSSEIGLGILKSDRLLQLYYHWTNVLCCQQYIHHTNAADHLKSCHQCLRQSNFHDPHYILTYSPLLWQQNSALFCCCTSTGQSDPIFHLHLSLLHATCGKTSSTKNQTKQQWKTNFYSNSWTIFLFLRSNDKYYLLTRSGLWCFWHKRWKFWWA